jgi:hypothetical protein
MSDFNPTLKLFLGTRKNKNDFIQILTHCFKEDPHMGWILDSKEEHFEKRLSALFSYLFEYTWSKGEIIFSQEKESVSAWLTHSPPRFNFRIFIEFINLFFALGIKRSIRLSKMDSKFAKIRKNQNHIYLLLLGVLETARGKGLAKFQINSKIENSSHQNLDIYLETSTLKNVSIYSKLGFQVYEEINLDENTKIYFMKRTRK